MISQHAFINLNSTQKKTPSIVKTRGRNCRVYKIPYRNKQHDRVILLVKCNENWSVPKGHLVYLRLKPMYIKNRLVPRSGSILNVPMKIFCKCPYFLYWGVQYNATQGKYLMSGQQKEKREPNIRDPKRENNLCKHLSAVKDSLKGQSIKKATKGNVSPIAKHSELEEKYFDSIAELDINLVVEDLPEVDMQEAIMILRGYVKEDIALVNDENFFAVAKTYGVVPNE